MTQLSGRPPMRDVPGMFTAKPIPNAKEEPLDQQTKDRLQKLSVEKRFESIAKRVIAWADAVECTDAEKGSGLRVIFDAVHERLTDQEALVLILESEALEAGESTP